MSHDGTGRGGAPLSLLLDPAVPGIARLRPAVVWAATAAVAGLVAAYFWWAETVASLMSAADAIEAAAG